MAHHILVSVALAASLLAGCAPVEELHCRPGEQPAIADLLYFGTAKPKGVVSEADWSDFLRSVVTPRFPAGLTAWPASGQWQSADEASEAAIRSIVSEYKSRFQQEAVLRIKSYACTSL